MNELAHCVMGTIFLVCMYVCIMYVCMYAYRVISVSTSNTFDESVATISRYIKAHHLTCANYTLCKIMASFTFSMVTQYQILISAE